MRPGIEAGSENVDGQSKLVSVVMLQEVSSGVRPGGDTVPVKDTIDGRRERFVLIYNSLFS